MYFMVNTSFTNYIDQFNLTEELKFPLLTNKTTSEYTLPIFHNSSKFDDSLQLLLRHLNTILPNTGMKKTFLFERKA